MLLSVQKRSHSDDPRKGEGEEPGGKEHQGRSTAGQQPVSAHWHALAGLTLQLGSHDVETIFQIEHGHDGESDEKQRPEVELWENERQTPGDRDSGQQKPQTLPVVEEDEEGSVLLSRSDRLSGAGVPHPVNAVSSIPALSSQTVGGTDQRPAGPSQRQKAGWLGWS